MRLMLTLMARGPPGRRTAWIIDLPWWTHRALSARLCSHLETSARSWALTAPIFLGGVYVKRLLLRVVLIASSITGLLLAGGASRIWR